KLQEDLAAIIVEWKEKEGRDIRSLREAFRQTAQRKRVRIARIEVIPQTSELTNSQIASNAKFRKQNNF
ncbi:7689_t:CDS:1, partial [Ambispora leptoticha]